MKKYLTYHLKWQLGFFVAWPCMFLFQDYLGWPYWATVLGFQFIGAIIFWPIDKFILQKRKVVYCVCVCERTIRVTSLLSVFNDTTCKICAQCYLKKHNPSFEIKTSLRKIIFVVYF